MLLSDDVDRRYIHTRDKCDKFPSPRCGNQFALQRSLKRWKYRRTSALTGSTHTIIHVDKKFREKRCVQTVQ